MSKVFRRWKTDEVWLLPPSVADFVPAGHPAHLIRDLVSEELDLSAIMSTYTEVKGYPPYHPAMMVALLLYAYRSGVYSSRRIARGCEERLDFQAVTALNQPDFRTISEFRRRHLDALAALFVQVLALCRRAGLVGLDHVAVDGTKLRANASKHKAMSYARMVEAEAELAREVDDWLTRAQAEDAAEDAAHGSDRRGDEPPDWMRDKQARLARIRAAKAELEAEAHATEAARPAAPCNPDGSPKARPGRKPKHPPGKPMPKTQRNFTDPQSRIMIGRDGFIQAYNAQAAVDADAQIIVAHNLTNNASDQDALLPLLQARLAERTTAEWLALLRGRVPCAPVNDVAEALQDEQVLAREMVIEVPSANWGPVRQPGNPIKIDGLAPRREPAPALGEHTERLLRELLGYSAERVQALRSDGAI
jgi:transposase